MTRAPLCAKCHHLKSRHRTLPHRVGYYSGNWGTSETCGERVTLTKTNKLRTHKAK